MYREDNVFAKILRSEIPCKKVYEDESILAFHDAYPVAPVHVLVIPKHKYTDYNNFIGQSSPETIANFFSKIKHITEILNLTSYRLVTNKGSESGQSVFHFHAHIISGKKITTLA
jgi:diadenosine tetraphosphate (Ap4A) HIT family hydrolase